MESDIVTTCLTLVQDLTADGCAGKKSLDEAKAALDQVQSLALLTKMTLDGSNLTVCAQNDLTATCTTKSNLVKFAEKYYKYEEDKSTGNYKVSVTLTDGSSYTFVWLKGEKGEDGKDIIKKKTKNLPWSWFYQEQKTEDVKLWSGSSSIASLSTTAVSASATLCSLGASIIYLSFTGVSLSAWFLILKGMADYFPNTGATVNFRGAGFFEALQAIKAMIFSYSMVMNNLPQSNVVENKV